MNQRSFGALFVLLSGCVSDGMMSDGGMDSSVDAPAGDGTIADGGTEAGDAPTDVNGDAGPVYSDITDTSKWETFDMSGLTNGDVHYVGGTFDGRYVYYSPTDSNNGRSGVLTRYDTTGTFKQAGAWEKFDISTKAAGLKGFGGAIFDGAYVYLTPYATSPIGQFVRYKTNQPFASAGSYEVADLISLVGANAYGFSAGAYDGKYVYISPGFKGLATRFDSAASFTSSPSYASQPTGTTFSVVGAFDGKYMYYVPSFVTGGTTPSGIVTRFDTTKAMNDNSAYLTFDTTGLDGAARGYGGAVFDGRYLMFIPGDGVGIAGSGAGSLVVRFDTQAQFDKPASWTKYDLVGVSPTGAHGYQGGTFDGRYIYFAPRITSLAIRYDTQKAFGSPMAWQAFDLSSINIALKSFYGAVFDGQHVYFVPYSGPYAVRFDAKTPPSLPAFASSFY
jgi:hypothetical protein